MANYKKSTTPDLVKVFAKAAAEQGEALRTANPKKANSRYRTMEKVYQQLKSCGSEHQRELSSLFDHKEGYVRLNAAAYLLEFDTPGALRVLQIIGEMESELLGFTAGMILKEWAKKHPAKACLPNALRF